MRTKIEKIERRLPFADSVKYKCESFVKTNYDPNGNGVEFELLPNTEILASRSGVVIESSQGLENCIDNMIAAHFKNKVLIEEDSGKFGLYIHVNPIVENGQRINEGDPIGNLFGYCNEPHLHFYSLKIEKDSIDIVPAGFPN